MKMREIKIILAGLIGSFLTLACQQSNSGNLTASSLPACDTIIYETADVSVSGQTAGNLQINGNVTYTNTYCGGVAPTQGVLDDYATKRPMSNSTILLIQDLDNNVRKEVSTNANGQFVANLPAGTYSYYMTERFDKKLGIAYNPECRLNPTSPYGSFTLQTNKQEINLNFHFICPPCEPAKP